VFVCGVVFVVCCVVFSCRVFVCVLREREREQREARRGRDATGYGNTTGENPTHRGPTQRGGSRRGPTTGGEGYTEGPHRTRIDMCDLFLFLQARRSSPREVVLRVVVCGVVLVVWCVVLFVSCVCVCDLSRQRNQRL